MPAQMTTSSAINSHHSSAIFNLNLNVLDLDFIPCCLWHKDLSHLSGRACQFGPSSPSWTDRFAPYLLVSRYPGRRCHWGSARSSLQGRLVKQVQDFPAFACAVWSCTVSPCCMRGCTWTRPCMWTCTWTGCSASCWAALLHHTCSPKSTWMCIGWVCNVTGCNRLACGMSMACTVRCVCTRVRGSCTSSLRWILRCCLPLCCQPRRRDVGNPREHTSPVKSQYPFGCFPSPLQHLLSVSFPARGSLAVMLWDPFQIHCISLQSNYPPRPLESTFRVRTHSSVHCLRCVREVGKDPYIPSGGLF